MQAGSHPKPRNSIKRRPLTFEVADECLVIHLDHSAGQQGHPVSSQASNKPRPVPAIREVIRKMLSFAARTFGSSTITRCRDYRDCHQMIRARETAARSDQPEECCLAFIDDAKCAFRLAI